LALQRGSVSPSAHASHDIAWGDTVQNSHFGRNALALSSALAFACGHNGSPSAGNAAGADGGTGGGVDAGTGGDKLPPETGKFAVTWQPQTTYVDRAHLGALVSADDSAYRYTFDAAAASAANLDLSRGRVLVIYAKALRKITAINSANGQIVVDTDFATFEDAMKEADIEFDQPMDFGSSTLLQGIRIRDPQTGELRKPISIKDQEATFKFSFGAYQVTMKISSKGQALAVAMIAERKDLLHVEFRADGQIETFTIHHKINIHDGNLVLLDETAEGAKAKMALSLTMLGGGKDDLNFTPEIEFLKLPLVEVGPIPVVWTGIGIQFVVKIVSPPEGSSRVEATFTYDTDAGLHYDGTNISDVARQRTVDFLKGVTQTGAASPIGANFGFNFPRFSVRIFNLPVVVYTGPGFLIGGSFTPFFPPCQTADADFLWTTKAELKLFALKLSAEYKKSLIEKKVALLRAGKCPK
jgi:hypothetical protein